MRALGVRKRLPLDLGEPDYITTDHDPIEASPAEADEELGVHDRPTLPVPPAPFESGVRLGGAAPALIGAAVDVVTADLTKDPRSESWSGPQEPSFVEAHDPEMTPRPAAFSLVRALRS